jgi:two-component system KDP operon response regulator KdpE
MSNQLALIVEDDKDQANLFARALRTAGFETEIARAGDTALAQLAVAVPDVVVLDLGLPQVTGADVLRQIRGDPRLENTQVIIVTGDPQRADDICGEADLVLIKPVGFNQLCDLATRLLSSGER